MLGLDHAHRAKTKTHQQNPRQRSTTAPQSLHHNRHPRSGRSHPDPLLAPVELHVVLAHEHIPQDPQRTSRSRHIDPGQPQNALVPRRLQHQVSAVQRVLLPSQAEGHARLEGVAVHDVLLPKDALRPQLGRNSLHICAGTSQQTRPGVHNRSLRRSDRRSVQLHTIQPHGPVRLARQGHKREVPGVVLRVHTPDHQLTRSVVPQVEGEHRIIQLLRVHQSVEWGLHSAHRNSIPRHAADPVKLPSTVRKSKSARVVHLSKRVLRNLHRSDRHRVLREHTGHRARPIHDLELSPVRLVRARLVVVVHLLERKHRALVGNPQVRRSRVVDHRLLLTRTPDRQVTEILSVLVVTDHHVSAPSHLRVQLLVLTSHRLAHLLEVQLTTCQPHSLHLTGAASEQHSRQTHA
mmetsp:Transcript_1505/g.3238  ORF Transcript_1505/g.3238 Transcript_1505/m.3238 type:complete len:406 (-) Transcript_1505:71-1288(-)